MILVDAPAHHGRPAHRLEFYRVALGNMLYHLRLRIGITPVGPGGMRHHGGIELLAEFPPQLGNTPLGIFRQLLRCRPVLDGVDHLPRLILEIPQQGFEFFLHLFDLRLLLFPSLGGEVRLFAFQFLLAGLKA